MVIVCCHPPTLCDDPSAPHTASNNILVWQLSNIFNTTHWLSVCATTLSVSQAKGLEKLHDDNQCWSCHVQWGSELHYSYLLILCLLWMNCFCVLWLLCPRLIENHHSCVPQWTVFDCACWSVLHISCSTVNCIWLCMLVSLAHFFFFKITR